MRSIRLATLVATLGLAAPALAADAAGPKGVVELFTSQGCSSCPKADIAFQALAADRNVVALSYHVDYWNYLGWNDTLSSPDHTRRQYDYAAALGRSNVYTPQAVVNGREHMNGADLPAIREDVDEMAGRRQGLDVPVGIERRADGIRIGIGEGTGKAHVVVAYFTRERRVRIEKGENAGKTISYRNVVSSVETIGMWTGKKLELTLPGDMLGKEGREGAAILLQGEGPDGALGPIRGAGLVPSPAI